MVDPMLSLTVVGGLDAALALAGVVMLTGPRRELRFVSSQRAYPDFAEARPVLVFVSFHTR